MSGEGLGADIVAIHRVVHLVEDDGWDALCGAENPVFVVECSGPLPGGGFCLCQGCSEKLQARRPEATSE